MNSAAWWRHWEKGLQKFLINRCPATRREEPGPRMQRLQRPAEAMTSPLLVPAALWNSPPAGPKHWLQLSYSFSDAAWATEHLISTREDPGSGPQKPWIQCFCGVTPVANCSKYKNMAAAAAPAATGVASLPSLHLLCSTTPLLLSPKVAAPIINPVSLLQPCNREEGISDFTALQSSPEQRRWPLLEVFPGQVACWCKWYLWYEVWLSRFPLVNISLLSLQQTATSWTCKIIF